MLTKKNDKCRLHFDKSKHHEPLYSVNNFLTNKPTKCVFETVPCAVLCQVHEHNILSNPFGFTSK